MKKFNTTSLVIAIFYNNGILPSSIIKITTIELYQNQ